MQTVGEEEFDEEEEKSFVLCLDYVAFSFKYALHQMQECDATFTQILSFSFSSPPQVQDNT